MRKRINGLFGRLSMLHNIPYIIKDFYVLVQVTMNNVLIIFKQHLKSKLRTILPYPTICRITFDIIGNVIVHQTAHHMRIYYIYNMC